MEDTRNQTPCSPCNPGPARRLVDCRGYGWELFDDSSVDPRYRPLTAPQDGTQYLTRLTAERGPLLRVIAAPTADVDLMARTLLRAGGQAAGTLLFALHLLRDRCSTADGDSIRLVAGDPQSPQAQLLYDTTWCCVSAAEVAVDVVEQVYKMLCRWVFGPDVFVEVASGVAAVFGQVVAYRGGWESVSTASIRSGERGEALKRLLLPGEE